MTGCRGVLAEEDLAMGEEPNAPDSQHGLVVSPDVDYLPRTEVLVASDEHEVGAACGVVVVVWFHSDIGREMASGRVCGLGN